MTRWSVVALDFDGVLVESVGIKDEAFEQLFSVYPNHIEAIMTYHLAHNATVRFDKFRHILGEILHEEVTPEREKQLSDAFGEIVYRRIVECPWVSGAVEFLEEFHRRTPLYLVSASPDGELSRILEARRMRHYFKDVFASPIKKVPALREILSREGAESDQVVFVGDTMEDSRAAGQAGVGFLGRDSGKVWEEGIPLYPSMSEVSEALRARME